jgi:thioredoxin 1
MKVELFHTIGCKSCADAREALKAAAQGAVPAVVWRDVDVTRELDYAVEIGVLALPAIAVDGRLAFSTLPTPEQLAAELQRRAQRGRRGR